MCNNYCFPRQQSLHETTSVLRGSFIRTLSVLLSFMYTDYHKMTGGS